jgi:tRNA/tmRNA/rRNA uracil-C5-methylase (TrmA/RlmC/RlmD family)
MSINEYLVEINRVNWFGLGVSEINSEVYCVPNSKIGDRIWVLATQDRFEKKIARPILSLNPHLEQTLKASPCPYLLSCPGCVLLERSKIEQQQIQESTHMGAMSRILEIPADQLSAKLKWESLDLHLAYRSKLSARIKVQKSPHLKVDFILQDRWGEIDIPLKACVVQNQESRDLLRFLSDACSEKLIQDHRLIAEFDLIKMMVVYALQSQVSLILIHREQLENPQDSLVMQMFKEIIQNSFLDQNLSIYTQLSSSLQPKKTFPLIHCFGPSSLIYEDIQVHPLLNFRQKFQYTPPSWISQNPSSIGLLRQIIWQELTAIAQAKPLDLKQLNLIEFGSGIGISTLWLAPYLANILGVELMYSAYLDALQNLKLNRMIALESEDLAQDLALFENVHFRCADAKRIMPKLIKEGFDFQVALIHAMRAELHPLLLALGQAKVDTVIYLAPCAPSLARDIKASMSGGIDWEIQKLVMLDQMPGTATAMTIAILKRKEIKDVLLLCDNNTE